MIIYKPQIRDAIYELHPTAKFNLINGDDWEHVEWTDKNIAEPSQSDVETKLSSMISEWDAQEYARNRKEEYDALNQFELISDDTINGTSTHKDAIEAIKAKYPKP